MGPKTKARLFAKWERILEAEGLAPLDTARAINAEDFRRKKMAKTPAAERQRRSDYYTRCEEGLERLQTIYNVWALHCRGEGRGVIQRRLKLAEWTVRTALEDAGRLLGLPPVLDKGGRQ